MAGLDLGKQVGPLPLGGWLVVVGGGLAIGIYMNKRQAAADSGANDAETSTQLTESDTGEGGAQFVYTPPVPVAGIGDNPETNDEWGRQVVNWLVGTMGVAGTTATNTVSRYLAREVLTAVELAQMNLAIGHFGSPPEPLAPVDQPTDPGTTTPPTDTTALSPRFVTGLHVAKAKGINSLGWSYKGNATSFDIRAIIVGTNKFVNASVNAIPDGQAHNYGWQHIAGGSIKTAHTYDYRVIPRKGSETGTNRTARGLLRP